MARRGPPIGDRTPLFERLADDAPAAGEARPQRILDADGARRSVMAELSRLLNTRRGPAVRRSGAAATVLGYGVPDHALDNPASVRDQEALCADVAAAIRAFEPRLRDVRVWVLDDTSRRGRIALGLTGTLVLGRQTIPVSFPVTFSSDGASVGDDDAV
jgi:type VI secretion system lysozyme-like protein